MEDVTDASDWTVAELREFDSKLRCPICHNYYRATMMLPTCLHNFCSLCIRRALLGERKCPMCMMTVSKDELIGNHLIDQLVSSFVAARPILLRALQPREGREPGRLPVDAIQSSMGRTRQGNTEGNDGDGGEAWAKPDDGMQCPVCQGHFSQELIEDHVDRCLSHASTNKDPLPRPSLPVANHATKQPVTMHHMRRPVYNLLKDSEIKKLLRDLDLPTGGNRDMMIRRHSEFVLLYNAECDASHPKSLTQLRAEVRAMERAWSQRPAKVLLDYDKDADFDISATKYRKANAEHYSSLIERVKGYTSSRAPTGGGGGGTSNS